MFLLDTDIATHAFKKHPVVLARLASAERPVRLPVTTRLEILRGRIEAVRTAADSGQVLRAQQGFVESETFLTRFEPVFFDPAAGAYFDRFRTDRKFEFKGGRDDLLIACIALANDATLVTRNTKDFAAVPGLKLDNWAD